METSGYKSPTRLYPYEGKTESTPRRDHNVSPQRMDASKDANGPKRHGHVGGKDPRPSYRKRRNESRNHATRRIRTQGRVYAKRTRRRRNNERPTRS